MGCPCGNTHSTRLALCRHFTAFAELFSLLFLVVSFQDSLTLEEPVKVSGSIGKNDSNREMNLRAKPTVMNQLINHRACDKMKGHKRHKNGYNKSARAMTFGLGGKLKLLFIRNVRNALLFFWKLHRSGIERPQSGISGILTGRPPVGM